MLANTGFREIRGTGVLETLGCMVPFTIPFAFLLPAQSSLDDSLRKWFERAAPFPKDVLLLMLPKRSRLSSCHCVAFKPDVLSINPGFVLLILSPQLQG